MSSQPSKPTYDPDRPLSLRTMITPEGVDLGVRLADMGQRFGALTLDLMFILLFLLAGVLLVVAAGGSLGGEVAIILIQLIFFALRNFYFLFFEMGTKAATPGKRLMKIRVASRHCAQLDTSSVFARNAMREIELFIPVLVLLSGGSLTGQNDLIDQWIWLVAVIWVCLFAFFPLFNRDRLRLGDLVAGTWVVRAPKPVLLDDLTARDQSSDAFNFTPAQIGAYGIKELHVLEDVLRARDPRVMAEVAERIRTKIKWSERTAWGDEAFLRAYYGALRGRLETGLLMGRRRKDKHDQSAN